MSFIGNLFGTSAYLKHARGKEDEARILYERAMKHKMNSIRNLLSYAVMLLRSGDFEKAVEVLRYADRLPGKKESDSRQIRTHYAIAQWKLGNLRTSVELLEELHRNGPTGMVYGTLGYIYIAMKDFDKALSYNLEALEYDDEDYVILDNVGQTYFFLGDREKAKGFFERALKKRATLVDSLYYLASILYEEGEYARAHELLETAQESTLSALSNIKRDHINELMARVQSKEAEQADHNQDVDERQSNSVIAENGSQNGDANVEDGVT